MAYTTTRYSAQFGLRILDNIQAFIEASTATALAEIDATLRDFTDFRTPTPIVLNFPALFVSTSNEQLEQSDDDSQQVEMTNRKFKEMIKEQMQQIFAKENSIDVALLNMRSWKHGHDGDHTVYLSAIIPSVLNEVVAKTTSKTSKKAGFDMLKAEMLTYKEIIRSFA